MKWFFLVLLPVIVEGSTQKIGKDSCYAQLDTLTKLEVYKFVDIMPSVEGGMNVLYTDISRQLGKIDADEKVDQGKIVIAFIIDTTGQVIGERVIKGAAGSELMNGILETIRKAKWKPGSCKGTPVPVIQLLPIYIDFK